MGQTSGKSSKVNSWGDNQWRISSKCLYKEIYYQTVENTHNCLNEDELSKPGNYGCTG